MRDDNDTHILWLRVCVDIFILIGFASWKKCSYCYDDTAFRINVFFYMKGTCITLKLYVLVFQCLRLNLGSVPSMSCSVSMICLKALLQHYKFFLGGELFICFTCQILKAVV
jgi:hypothetical protein